MAKAIKDQENNKTLKTDSGSPAMEMLIKKTIKPYAPMVSFGGGLGFCAGMAAKKVGKAAATTVGIGFIGLQFLAYKGFITINWQQIQEKTEKALDQDGNGKFDGDDLQIIAKKLWHRLSYQMAGGAGFAAGFLVGFRNG